jgi:hypothetical protein
MASRVPRLLLGLAVIASAACHSPEVLDGAARGDQPGPDYQPGRVAGLPAGAGRDILVTECLNCHELDALELFKDFYNKERWRSLVVTMRENGAQVDDTQVDTLAEYLALHFGTGVE